jgi:uncharacterized protein YerC
VKLTQSTVQTISRMLQEGITRKQIIAVTGVNAGQLSTIATLLAYGYELKEAK